LTLRSSSRLRKPPESLPPHSSPRNQFGMRLAIAKGMNTETRDGGLLS
jgi:hypothetical protein